MFPPRTVLRVVISFLLFSLARSAPTDVPSAASFYVPTLPDLHQDPLHPLHIYAGHLNADPGAAKLPDTTITSHLYFVLIKARRTADKERIIFWFNVGIICILGANNHRHVSLREVPDVHPLTVS